MSRSEARVATSRPQRYAKQLTSHLGRRTEAVWDSETAEGRLGSQDGLATLTAVSDALLLTIETADDTSCLARLEDVVGRHLVRFGAKDELVVEWQRDTGEPGHTFRSSEEGT